MRTPKILVAGAGLTGCMVAALLRKILGPKCALHVWEKDKHCGGRMLTYPSPRNNGCSVDLGAQYITATPGSSHVHKDIYNELISSGLLVQMSCRSDGMRESPSDTRHFVSPKGTGSLVAHFLSSANPEETRFETSLERVALVGSVGATAPRWEAGNQFGEIEAFDVVVITFPAPLVLRIGGTIAQLIESDPSLHSGLKQVSYSARFALGLFYNNVSSNSSSGPIIKEEWDMKYVESDPAIRFVSIDNRKTGVTSVVIHSTIGFGTHNLDLGEEEAGVILEREVARMFPHWPKPSTVKFHKWTHSQVVTSYPGQPGCVVINKEPLLLIGGDSFSPTSNFDGCVFSATRLADEVLDKYHQ